MVPKGKPILFNSQTYSYSYLSNFYPSPIVSAQDGQTYPSVEHYYQAMKFEGTAHAETIRAAPTPREAKMLGASRDYPIREDWEDIKDQVMRDALVTKFGGDERLRRRLLDDTKERPLVHNAIWDEYWGTGRDGKGQNKLGVILMEIRDQLRKGEIDEAALLKQAEDVESLKQEIERLKQEIADLKEHRWMKIGRALDEVATTSNNDAKRPRTDDDINTTTTATVAATTTSL